VDTAHRSDSRTHGDSLRWTIALDTGGTFTDIVAQAPDGSTRRAKIPSDASILATVVACEGAALHIAPAAGLELPDGLLEGWQTEHGARVVGHCGARVELDRGCTMDRGQPVRFVRPARDIDAPRLGIHIVTATPLDRQLPAAEIRLSTTRGTNALLERRGARVGVLVSKGLRGVVEIGDQTRPDLFARVPERVRGVADAVREIPERSLAGGSVEHRAGRAEVLEAAEALVRDGCDAIVLSLAHALANDREREIAQTLRDAGHPAVAACDIAPHPRLLTRTETACVHARIAPILARFVHDATRSMPTRAAGTSVFTSAGVLQRADRLLARDTLYSGPAGGARAVCEVARRHAIAHAVGFDMGGTSTDVSRVAEGAVALRGESRIDRMTVAAPSVAIDSVAAGGGSICRIRDGALEVGPESAGANPGPACYARGGPLTVTDLNLLAGRMATGDGSMSLDRARASAALRDALRGSTLSDDAATAGFLDIANARMALAIESLCVRDGVDPRRHALVAFGGAGGQHACAVADRLGITRIVFPRFAGFMCAQGVFDAVPARFATTTVLRPLDACADELARLERETMARAAAELAADGVVVDGPVNAAATESTIALRLAGQESAITLAFASPADLRKAFAERFTELFGYAPPARAIEVVSIEARASAAAPARPAARLEGHAQLDGSAKIALLSEGLRCEATGLLRANLAADAEIAGPALITDAGETVVIDRSWRARVDRSGDLVAERREAPVARSTAAEQELFSARLESIALSMGNLLERTALSPNIRDRLDFSCAVLDAQGTLVQNAPHLPVHLGALGACTRLVARAIELGDGDIAVTNHPAYGGSHLPDVTTVAPVFAGGARVGFVAVRAHHAEIGGTRPGSFPPDARSLAEEGVVLEPFLAVRAGAFDRDLCRARFAGGPHPSRNPDENLADLEAQVAATRYGVARVAELAAELGDRFAIRCEGELARADRAMQRAIERLGETRREASRKLDDGAAICVRVESAGTARQPRLSISFAGSSGVHPRNFNTPLAVTRAATLYVLRLLIDEPVPMNEGLLRSIDLDVPEGMLHPPFTADPLACPPVVAGNVETSQSVVAALIAAFGFAAESQSTMNNVLFGNARFTIYETLGGGAGASPDRDGASGVHVHMSNTRLTDIDVLERRAPVVIRRFGLRTGTGGDGMRRGGDGIVRAYEFREPVSLSFFASRRAVAPEGLDGGAPGATGGQRMDEGGRDRELSGSVLSLELGVGDRFTVETPGGGGAGRA